MAQEESELENEFLDGDELLEEEGILALTTVESWAPYNSLEFRTAATCHFGGPYDYHAIFAAFTVELASGAHSDFLVFLEIDGRKKSGSYGELLGGIYLSQEPVISNIDCATDHDGNVFVTWDRSDDPYDTLNARWGRVTVSGYYYGHYPVPACEVGASFATSIAYHDETIVIAGCGRGTCPHCIWLWDDPYADPPDQPIEHELAYTQQMCWATDAVWNENDDFITAHLIREDVIELPRVIMTRIDPYGTNNGAFALMDDDWTYDTYENVDLVLSNNSRNPNSYLLVETGRRIFWTTSIGQQILEPQDVGPWVDFAGCEYWGNYSTRFAHSYSRQGATGTLRHLEWYNWPSSPINSYYIFPNIYAPVACASSELFTDAEVLLVRRHDPDSYGMSSSIYFNMEPQN